VKPIYEHKQPGYAIVGLILIPSIFFTLVVGLSGEAGTAATLLIILIFMLGTAVIFSSLTVKVSTVDVTYHFALSFFNHVIPMHRITEVRVVRNKIWYGLGIHFIPGGVVYNVSGLDAVEIRLDDCKLVRLGTDEPEKLAAAIDHVRRRNRSAG
jgi:hypothetical protein